MRQHETFVFDGYGFDAQTGVIELRYALDDVRFVETVKLPKRGLRKGANRDLLDRALRTLHLIGGVSYWKTCCPKRMEIRGDPLHSREAAFYQEVYENGLAQFFYENHIDFRGLIAFPSVGREMPAYVAHPGEPEKPLVPFGGGKDSVVTAEILRAAGIKPVLLRMNRHPLIARCARVGKFPLLTVERTLSPNLHTLNLEGALNGHVPITAYLSALTVVLAVLYGFKDIVMSNERSANEGSLLLHGKEVNHQWSKSLQFERLFQRHLKEFVTPDLRYFSLLRPWSELMIVRRFARHPQYFPCTTSCNGNWKLIADKRIKDLWCGACPKCAFVFTLFAAELPKETVLAMFRGKDLLSDPALLPFFRQLLGIEGFKPFECVGTAEEMRAALLLARERGEWNDTPVLQLFLREALPRIDDAKAVLAAALHPTTDHALPPDYATVLPPEP